MEYDELDRLNFDGGAKKKAKKPVKKAKKARKVSRKSSCGSDSEDEFSGFRRPKSFADILYSPLMSKTLMPGPGSLMRPSPLGSSLLGSPMGLSQNRDFMMLQTPQSQLANLPNMTSGVGLSAIANGLTGASLFGGKKKKSSKKSSSGLKKKKSASKAKKSVSGLKKKSASKAKKSKSASKAKKSKSASKTKKH